jgi:peptidyl-tRNA hydrolase
VLSRWNVSEEKELPFICDNAIEALNLFVRQGIERAMNLVNTDKQED